MNSNHNLTLAVVAIVLWLPAAFVPASAQQTTSDDALRVLPPRGNLPRSEGPLRDLLRKKSQAALDRRLERFEKLKTPEDVATYQRELREHFIQSLGGFPERAPLNARTVGTFAGEGYRGEKIIYESQPGFFVTANLYLPEGKPPFPGVLMPCGHTRNGKAGYQRPAMLLAQNGLAVLCFDPIGQGERNQILTEDKGSGEVRAPFAGTGEHTVDGIAPILLGRSLATYMIWDGIRGIDYLASRKEIDAGRIGCTGNSGGGMMTSYLMALDERIVSAAPGCFITTSRRKNESPGPGDAEQNIFSQYAYGLDHPDFLILHAPQPALICSATQDFVPIAGAWEAFRQAKRVYTRLGFAERMELVETDAKHGFSVQLREGTTRWMRRWLLDKDDAVVERDEPAVLPDRELQCTPRGQVLLLEGARSVFDLNRAEAKRLAAERKEKWKSLSVAERRHAVRDVSRIRPLEELPAVEAKPAGMVKRDGYRIEKLLLSRPDGMPLPALRFVPGKRSGKRACLYLHGRGKQVDAAAGGPIERLVGDGVEVLAVDLSGCGETEMHAWRTGPAEITGNNGAEFYVAYMLGESLVGIRTEDALVCARYLALAAGDGGKDRRNVDVVGLEEAAIPVLHAAALEPDLFAGVRLVRSIDSWNHVIETPVTHRQLEGVVHGALRVYDLPDLVELAEK